MTWCGLPYAGIGRRGNAAFIADTSDFFIGTADHTEWGGAFTVFAEVVVSGAAGREGESKGNATKAIRWNPAGTGR